MKMISRSDTQKFLQDVADLETKAFTLEQLAEEYDENTKRETRNLEFRIEKASGACKMAQKTVQEYKEEVDEQRGLLTQQQEHLKQLQFQYDVLDENTIAVKQIIIKDEYKSKVAKAKTAGCGIGCLGTIIAYLAIAAAFLILNEIDNIFGVIFSLIGFPLVVVLATILCTIGAKIAGKRSKKKAYYVQRKDELEKEIEKERGLLLGYEARLREKEDAWQKAEQSYQLKVTELTQLQAEKALMEQQLHCSELQIAKCLESAQTIRGNLVRIYETADLIPPDYREMDCVLAFQQIFRNDLADTMREAVMIYEQRVYRQEVIRGMDRIYHELQDLNSSMYYIKHTLTGIRDNVSMMSQDLFQVVGKMDQMSQQMSDGGKLQDKLLRETKASRYAIDAIRQSQSKCEEYLEKMQSSSE